MGTISEFKNVMTQGGARSNQFQVIFTLPAKITNEVASKSASFLCNAASLPASEMADATVFYRGRQVSFAGERTFRPWTVTLYNDTDLSVRTVFENWINIMSQADATYGHLNSKDYQVDMQVNQLDRNDNVKMTYNFINAFPINVGDVNLSWDENNRIQVYNVTFQYNYWMRLPAASTFTGTTGVVGQGGTGVLTK